MVGSSRQLFWHGSGERDYRAWRSGPDSACACASTVRRATSHGKPRRARKRARWMHVARPPAKVAPKRLRNAAEANSRHCMSLICRCGAATSSSMPRCRNSARILISPWPRANADRTKHSTKRESDCKPASASSAMATSIAGAEWPRARSLAWSSLREWSRRARRRIACALAEAASVAISPCSSSLPPSFPVFCGRTGVQVPSPPEITARAGPAPSSWAGCGGGLAPGSSWARMRPSTSSPRAGFSASQAAAFFLPWPMRSLL